MAIESKDTIYVDIDDEITSVIDKVQASSKSVVALVLPKRAPVFASIVNMKLLKRKSEEVKKNVVLVTTESGILPLAGAVGIHVAKTLASKPELPDPPEKADHFVNASEDEPISLAEEESVNLKQIADEPVGKLSSKAGKEEETIELDNAAIAAEAAEEASSDKKGKKDKKPSDKHLRVPDFEKFRLWAFIAAGVLILLIVLFILAAKILPKATIDISTNEQSVAANLNFNLSTTATSLNTTDNTVPAKQASETKTYTATVNTTGQSTPQVASGTLNVTAVSCASHGHYPSPQSIPAGTTVTQGSNSYTTQTTVYFDNGSTLDSNNCLDYPGSTTIVANSAGSSSNVSNANFNVSSSQSGVTYDATGTTTGGANAAQVVAQADISSAENKISTNATAAKTTLSNQLSDASYTPLSITFSTGTPNISPSTPVGGQATTVTVTETVTYTIYGVMASNLRSLIDSSVSSQVGSNQMIISSGLDNAVFSIGSGPTNLNLVTKATVGPNLNIAKLKHQIIGYKSGQIQALLSQNPDVKSVTVHFSPFFVSTVPSNPSRITINISKPS